MAPARDGSTKIVATLRIDASILPTEDDLPVLSSKSKITLSDFNHTPST
jgi:hypothetical protein